MKITDLIKVFYIKKCDYEEKVKCIQEFYERIDLRFGYILLPNYYIMLIDSKTEFQNNIVLGKPHMLIIYIYKLVEFENEYIVIGSEAVSKYECGWEDNTFDYQEVRKYKIREVLNSGFDLVPIKYELKFNANAFLLFKRNFSNNYLEEAIKQSDLMQESVDFAEYFIYSNYFLDNFSKDLDANLLKREISECYIYFANNKLMESTNVIMNKHGSYSKNKWWRRGNVNRS